MRWLGALVLFAACSSPKPPDPPPPPPPSAAQGEPCADRACAEGLECVRYYGIAGPAGPQLTSCERRCADGAPCPEGEQCLTLMDGPGQVCRPPPPAGRMIQR